MKVKIVRAGLPTYWYANKTGEEFEVEKGYSSLESGFTVAGFRVTDVNSKNKNDFIDRDDCVIVEGGASDNPKHIQAKLDAKSPMHLIPYAALEGVAKVMALGAEKYGERNWRMEPIKGSTYEGALFRHIFLEWAQGSDVDHESGEHPLDHAIASLLIMRDAMIQGTFVDDRKRKETKS